MDCSHFTCTHSHTRPLFSLTSTHARTRAHTHTLSHTHTHTHTHAHTLQDLEEELLVYKEGLQMAELQIGVLQSSK